MNNPSVRMIDLVGSDKSNVLRALCREIQISPDGMQMTLAGSLTALRGDSPDLVGTQGFSHTRDTWVVSSADNDDKPMVIRRPDPVTAAITTRNLLARTALTGGYVPASV